MKATLRTVLASLPIALAALAGAGPASAKQPLDIHVQVAQRPAYVADYHEREWRGEHEREWRGERRRHSCGAQRWNPQVRYAPGEVVRRHGELYVARRVSAHVWNVNSPPEWTPNYWAPARC